MTTANVTQLGAEIWYAASASLRATQLGSEIWFTGPVIVGTTPVALTGLVPLVNFTINISPDTGAMGISDYVPGRQGDYTFTPSTKTAILTGWPPVPSATFLSVTQLGTELWYTTHPNELVTQIGSEIWYTVVAPNNLGLVTQIGVEIWWPIAGGVPTGSEVIYRGAEPLRAQTQAPYDGNEIVIPAWIEQTAYNFVSGAASGSFASTPLSGTTYFGYSWSVSDGASGAWLSPFTGSLTHYAAGGGLTAYSYAATGLISLGVAVASGNPYTVDSLGRIYTVSGSSMAQVGAYGSTPAPGIVNALGKLWSLLANVSGVGSFDPGALTSGFVSVPMTVPAVLAGASNVLAVGGWNFASIPQAFSAVAPLSSGIFAAASLAASSVALWVNDGKDNWSQSQVVTGLGAPAHLAWSNTGTVLFAADTVNGNVYVLDYVFGALSLAQTLPLSGAAAVAVSLDLNNALVCQPGLNQITPLTFSGSAWAVSGSSLSVANAQSVLSIGLSDMVAGTASGLTTLHFNSSGVWSITSSSPLPFVPTYLVSGQTLGAYLAAGTSGGSGYVFTQGVTGSFTGGVGGLAYRQSQTYVADNVNNTILSFQLMNNAYTQKSSIAVASGVTALEFAGVSLLALAGGLTPQFKQYAPFKLKQEYSSAISAYNGTSWTTTALNVGAQPGAIAIDSSGTIWTGVLQNEMIAITASGGIWFSTQVTQLSGQPQSTPIGMSSFQWFMGHLFSTSSLSDEFIRVF